jgi:hypothetical protein
MKSIYKLHGVKVHGLLPKYSDCSQRCTKDRGRHQPQLSKERSDTAERPATRATRSQLSKMVFGVTLYLNFPHHDTTSWVSPSPNPTPRFSQIDSNSLLRRRI